MDEFNDSCDFVSLKTTKRDAMKKVKHSLLPVCIVLI